MTVDVEALMASRSPNPIDQPGPEPVDPVAHPIDDPINAPLKYASPLAAYYDYARNAANIQDQAAAAERAAAGNPAEDPEPDLPTGPVTVEVLYVPNRKMLTPRPQHQPRPTNPPPPKKSWPPEPLSSPKPS
jgi:hypothetical protein